MNYCPPARKRTRRAVRDGQADWRRSQDLSDEEAEAMLLEELSEDEDTDDGKAALEGDLSPVKRALLEQRRLKAKVEAMERERNEPIAIIGLGCRFPGADGPEAFWRLLMSGVDAIREVPADRWDIDALYDPDPDAPGRVCSRWGGFLDRVDLFDHTSLAFRRARRRPWIRSSAWRSRLPGRRWRMLHSRSTDWREARPASFWESAPATICSYTPSLDD